MTNVQPNLLQLAKQGDPKAIAALMNRSLQPKGKKYLPEFLQFCWEHWVFISLSWATPKKALSCFL
ncbi:hypothetical protein [Nostoc sp.]|uniref:hypothetical protein n=1 Tax=Nostoc sp. TaxID=1180 RepID=UPI002D7A3FD9|nr:hypothetical protein [Nostoc sp.]